MKGFSTFLFVLALALSLTAASAQTQSIFQYDGNGNLTNILNAPDAAPTITAPPTNQIVQIGSDATFSVDADGAGPLSYQWLQNGNAISGATNSSLFLPNVAVSNQNPYSVVVCNPYGCVTSTVAQLEFTWTWIASGPGDWYSSSNWDPAIVPTGLADITIPAGSTVNLSAPVTVAGSLTCYGATINSNSLTIASNGSLNLFGGTLNLPTQLFTENAALNVAEGGVLNVSNTWVNSGSGIVSNSTGGALNLAGTLMNSNATLSVNATGGSWTLVGGTIQGGTVTEASTNNLFIQSGILDAVTVNGGINMYLHGNASLIVSNTLTINGSMLLGNGGTIFGGIITDSNGVPFVVAGNATFNGVTFNGLMDLGYTYDATVLTVTNGLTLNGTVELGNTTNYERGILNFQGNQTLGGNGTIALGRGNGGGNMNQVLVSQGTTTLTIGPGITIEGQNGVIGSGSGYDVGGPLDVSVINQGTISADVTNGTIVVNAQPFSNQGLAEALNGGVLELEDAWNGTGQIDVSSNGVLNLNGSATATAMGVINNTNGTVELTGTIDNTGNTLVLAGAWLVIGGTFINGTVAATNGFPLIVDGSGTLDGVTINGVLDVGRTYDATVLTVASGLNVDGTVELGNLTNYERGILNFVGTQTLGGNGTVVMGRGNGGGNMNQMLVSLAGTALTIGPGVTIEGQNGVIGSGSGYDVGGPLDVGVVNQGTILANVSGGTIVVDAEPFSNQGVAQAINGGALELENSWNNTGQINVGSTGVLNFNGTVTGAAVGTINDTNGTIELTGTVNNTGNTLLLSGTWILDGGTILNGTVMTTNGLPIIVEGSGTFDGVTIDGVLDVGRTYDGTVLAVTGGLNVNGTVELGNLTNFERGILNFEGSQTLGGNGTVVMGRGNGGGSINQMLVSLAGTTLTIGPGMTIEGQNGVIGSGSGYYVGGPLDVGVVNQGTILANVSGGTIVVDAEPFDNEGVAQALNGGSLELEDTWDNTGQIDVGSSSALNLNGNVTGAAIGTINETNGTVQLTGTVDNTGNTLVLTGTWLLNGGTIINGTVVATNNGASLVADNGTLNGVTVNGLLDVGNSVNATTLTVVNGLTLNGTALVGNPTNGFYADMAFAGSQTLGGNGTVIFGNDGNYSYNTLRVLYADTTLTIGPGIEVRGQNGVIGYPSAYGGSVANVGVTNQGTIQADVNGGTITISAEPFDNEGVVQALNGGTLTLQGMWSSSGQLNAGTNSVLNLSGSFTGSSLSGVNRTNGTVDVTGTVDNTGNTLVLSGAWVLNGGTIINGIVVATNGASLIVQGQSAEFNAVTFDGLLDLGNTYDAAMLSVVNGFTLNGMLELGNPTNFERGILNFEGSQTLGGNGTVVMGRGNGGGNMNQVLVSLATTTLTIGPGITIEGQNGVIGSGSGYDVGGPLDVSVVNQGTISASVSGGTIVVDADPFDNEGVAQAVNGGSLELENSWNNTGQINVSSSSVLNFNGNVTGAGVGTINDTNGTIELTGTINNTGNTLVLTGTWLLNGGTIINGTVVATNGASLVADNGTLNGVTVNGLLDVGNSVNATTLTVVNGLTLNGTALVGNPTNSAYADMAFAGSQTLGGNGTVIFGNNGNYSYNTLRVLYADTTLTIGPGIEVRGQNGVIGYPSAYGGSVANVGVNNQGTIQADVSGGTITISAEPFDNLGVAQALNGGTLTLVSTWSNSGQLNVGTNSALNLNGSFTGASLSGVNRTNGAIYVTGTLDNTGNTLVLAGAWVLNGGSIINGTVVATNGASLVADGSGTLAGVTINGLLDVGNTYDGTVLTLTSGLTVDGIVELGNPTNYERGILNFEGSQTLGGNGMVVMGRGNGGGNMNQVLVSLAGTTLTIGSGITIEGQNGVIGSGSGYDVGGPLDVGVINQGTISATVSGGTITVNAQPFNNDSVVDSEAGTVELEGNISLPNGTLEVGINGPNSNGVINFASVAGFNGALQAHLNGGYVPVHGSSFTLLNYPSYTGAFSGIALPPVAQWQVSTGATALAITLTNVLVPFITNQPQSQIAAVGSAVTFTVGAIGSTPFSYQWQFNGTNLADGGQISGSKTADLAISNVAETNAGAYSVVITNAYGSTESAAANLAVAFCTPQPAGIVAWWPANGTAVDIVGGNNGTLVGGVSYAPGEVGEAFDFGGVNGYVSIPSAPALNLTNAMTIEGWINLSNLNTYYFIAVKGPSGTAGNGTSGNYEFRVAPGGTLQFLYQTTAAGSLASYGASSAFSAGAWHHVAVTLISGGNVNFYLDGLPAGSSAQQGTFGLTNSQPLLIGTRADAYSYFNGLIDELSLYNVALSSSEIASIYAAGPAGKCVNILPITSTNIVIARTNNNQLVLSWPASYTGWQLQAQTNNLGTNWVNVNGSTITNEIIIPINPANRSMFFRLVYP